MDSEPNLPLCRLCHGALHSWQEMIGLCSNCGWGARNARKTPVIPSYSFGEIHARPEKIPYPV